MGNKLPLFNLRNKRYTAHWYADKRDYPKLVLLNHQIREVLREESVAAKFEISNVVIHGAHDIKVDVHTLKPGVVLGKSGSNIALLKNKILAKTGLDAKNLYLNLITTSKPEIDARIIALRIASDIEKRRSYNYSMRSNAEEAMRFGALGVQIRCAGRLNGVDIAKVSQEKRGKISKNTIRANMYHALEHVKTRSGTCGVQVWLNLPSQNLMMGKLPRPQEARRRPPRSDQGKNDYNKPNKSFNRETKEVETK